ncbi:hypothetical protein [Aneurinibacillus tyrosinisolvens]|uniref:hypothetical protein n=1 Tax=Aneurinibacillus tyrosinisolvens TaxID=1443435 RepID=UPI00063F33FD|nr:hypothetical protein [Aneurinibacillus tyrosinisolvens]
MKKKIVIGALLLLCIFGAVKLIWFSNPSSQTANSAKPGQQSQDYAESETKLEKIDSSAPKLVNLGAALKKEIENARKNAKEKEGTFKKSQEGQLLHGGSHRKQADEKVYPSCIS